jgi:hypothetical protein
VSPDGQWIAGIATKQPAGTWAVFLVNVANPTNVHTASPADTSAVLNGTLQFSGDSQQLYFVARVVSSDNVALLYRTAVATPDQSELISAPRTASSVDEVINYAVAPDQAKLMIWAGIGDFLNLYYVDPANPRNEIRLNPQLDAGSAIFNSGVRFGSANRVAYLIGGTVAPIGNFIADLSDTPNPRPMGFQDGSFMDLRPDGQAALFKVNPVGQDSLVEAPIDSAQTTVVGDNEDYLIASYDERGDAVITQVFHDNSPGFGFLTLSAAVRPAFGTTHQMGTPGMASLINSFTGVNRAISVIGEGPEVQPSPPVQSVRLALANAWAPDKLLYVTDLLTSRSLKGSRASLVDP